MALAHPSHYKEQLKLIRAETAASWFAGALGWIVDALTQPLAPEHDVGAAPRSHDFPAFHC